MTDLRELLETHVNQGTIAGAVALVTKGEQLEVAVAGHLDLAGTAPMARDSIFRLASTTKPIAAAAGMVLVDDGRIGLDDPVARWLPEIAAPRVVRTPSSPLDDTVAAERPITVRHLLASRSGWGFPADFSLPAIQPLFSELSQGPSVVQLPVDEWMNRLARIPLLHQPGDGWLYNTSYDVLGVLIARVSGQSLPEFMAERLFTPLGMRDTGFAISPGSRDRLSASYQPTEGGTLKQIAGIGEHPSGFPSGAGGLLSTADDYLQFARMLLAGGQAPDGTTVLSGESVRLMTTNQLSEAERDGATIFLEGQGWGYGGAVDVAAIDRWNVPGRYGWVGGTGTAAHVVPSSGLISILLTQTELTSPTPPAVMRDFWTATATS
jgi:CubicO group peptidase (beta-lactamase class C family)